MSRQTNSLMVAFAVVLVLILLYHSRITIYKHYSYWLNNKFYAIMEQMETSNITIDNIPSELKQYLRIINIPNIQRDPNLILDEFLKRNESLRKMKDDLFIYDTLDFAGAYFPTAHTDIEWNKIKNDGFQVWSLFKNDYDTGNMFILYNKYLYDKYKDTAIFLRVYNGQVAVIKQCVNAELFNYINTTYIYELIPIETFIRTTKKYYLDFKAGDSMMFAKNMIHMSDYRNSSNHRKAYNFRVAIKDANKLNISSSNCGYVNDSNFHSWIKDARQVA